MSDHIAGGLGGMCSLAFIVVAFLPFMLRWGIKFGRFLHQSTEEIWRDWCKAWRDVWGELMQDDPDDGKSLE